MSDTQLRDDEAMLLRGLFGSVWVIGGIAASGMAYNDAGLSLAWALAVGLLAPPVFGLLVFLMGEVAFRWCTVIGLVQR